MNGFAKKITLRSANCLGRTKVLLLLLIGLTFLSSANATILIDLEGNAEPMMELDGKQPVACGFLISAEPPWGGKYSLTIGLVASPPATFLRVRLLQFDAEARRMKLAAPFAEKISFKKGADARTWDAIPTPAEGAQVMHALMVHGLQLKVEDGHGRIFAFGGPRPMPQNVRATYLNCTGDMYRQE